MALKEMTIPDAPKLYTKQYANLCGVDYSCDISEVALNRTPTGTNMISDRGGNPVKRLGWRYISKADTIVEGKILKIIPWVLTDEQIFPHLWVITSKGIFFLRRADDSINPNWTETKVYEEVAHDNFTTNVSIGGANNCVSFVFNGELYCTLSSRYRRSGVEIQANGLFKLTTTENSARIERVEGVNAYVPEATIGLAPNGTGGTSLEPVNLLSPSMMFSFCGDDTSTTYYLYPEALRNDPDKKYIVNETGALKVEVLSDEGAWTELTKGTDYTVLETTPPLDYVGWDITGLNARTHRLTRSYITFTEPHPALVPGRDNVRITFQQWDAHIDYDNPIGYQTVTVPNPNGGSHTTQVPQYAQKGLKKDATSALLNCSCCATYGHTTADRMFLGGFQKEKYRNRVYYSAVNDATYFPDNNYLTVGHDDNLVMALQKVGDYLAVVKNGSVLDCTLYLIRGSYLDDSMYFMVVPTSVQEGCIATGASQTLIDEPLFLSRTGIYAITGSNFKTEEKTIRNRSGFINKRLLDETNLEQACATVWDRYYILCANSHCYVLDGRHYNADNKRNSDYYFEAYYWENVPAVTLASFRNELYFGTENGKICKFNTDILPANGKYTDGATEWAVIMAPIKMLPSGEVIIYVYDPRTGELIVRPEESDYVWWTYDLQVLSNGTSISCEWSTLLDDDGAPQLYKTLDKKGNVITLLGENNTPVTVKLVKDGVTLTSLDTFYTPTIDWVAARYSSGNTKVADDFLRKKVKKYKRLQIIVQNNSSKPFGLLKITKTYSYGNYAKR